MKALFCTVITLVSSITWAQDNKDFKQNYFTFYPVEALMGHVRIGYEKEYKNNKSFLIEGQYYFTDDRIEYVYIPRKNYFGFALKSEIRFYKDKNKNRVFWGTSLMLKRNENMRFDGQKDYNNFVFSLNLKKGVEYFMSQNFKIDLYYGIGIRYKTIGISPLLYIDEPQLANDLFYPNLLLGVNLKFR